MLTRVRAHIRTAISHLPVHNRSEADKNLSIVQRSWTKTYSCVHQRGAVFYVHRQGVAWRIARSHTRNILKIDSISSTVHDRVSKYLTVHSFLHISAQRKRAVATVCYNCVVYVVATWARSMLAMMRTWCESDWSYVLELLECSSCRCGSLLIENHKFGPALIQLMLRKTHVYWRGRCHYLIV